MLLSWQPVSRWCYLILPIPILLFAQYPGVHLDTRNFIISTQAPVKSCVSPAFSFFSLLFKKDVVNWYLVSYSLRRITWTFIILSFLAALIRCLPNDLCRGAAAEWTIDMARPASYNTRQRETVLNYIASLDGAHVTAAQIAEHFEGKDIAISRTTIFRCLDKLTRDGTIRKYITDGISGACYQYASNTKICHAHFHLKCEDCEKLLHLECDKLSEIESHILNEHSFQVNAMKTVLYGKCDTCLKKA